MHLNSHKRVISLLLALVLVFSSVSALASCLRDVEDGAADSGTSDNQNTTPDKDSPSDEQGDDQPPKKEDYHDKVILPPFKDYDRATIDFSAMVYSRPNIAAVNREVGNVTAEIIAAEKSYEEQLSIIEALEPHIEHVLTMNSFASLYNYKDSSVAFWCDEVAFFAANYSSLVKAVEDLYVAAANSPYAERFESEYFGDGLIEEYRDGGIYTENAVKLLADEEALIAEYNALSSSTVKITFAGETDTLDNILSRYRSKYGESSTEYLGIEYQCRILYMEKVERMTTDIFISLLKVRQLIADELGYESYADYAYENYGRPYSPAVTSDFLGDIAESVAPVLQSLYSKVFYYYFQKNDVSEIPLDVLINSSYKMLGDMDNDLADIYAYFS